MVAVVEAQVWLVRHGQSVANAGGVTSLPSDIALTEQGRAQAQMVAERVSRRPDLIVSSPYLRARDTAEPLRRKFPRARHEVWPIQEFTYLDPQRCQNMTDVQRMPLAEGYWEKSDPSYHDGPETESFADFVQRIMVFHERLCEQKGFVVVFGHGYFFKAYLIGLKQGFSTTPDYMKELRYGEAFPPISNGQILEIK